MKVDVSKFIKLYTLVIIKKKSSNAEVYKEDG